MQPEDIPGAQFPSSLASAPEIPTLASRLKWPFWGPNGLRALWRLLIFVAIVFALRFPISHFLREAVHARDFTAKTVLLFDGVRFLVVLAASAIMAAFEKRSLADYGLPGRGAFGARFFEGLLWGFVAESATMLTL